MINIIKISKDNRGDTLVEVMLATAVLSLVLAGAFSITNKATRVNQSANERTQVSNLMQREAELLRASKDADSAVFWAAINTGRLTSTENTSPCDISSGNGNPSDEAFYTEDNLTISDITLASGNQMLDYEPNDLFDVWVEAVNGPAGTYTDFFIYGCWEGIGGEVAQSSGLVMRLSR